MWFQCFPVSGENRIMEVECSETFVWVLKQEHFEMLNMLFFHITVLLKQVLLM